ncbi:adenosylcobinamide-GDP ribazoletransferase [Thiohalorhabdus denitrificans]|uniref:Adenosylcobinamide-GDP ribazoletransferase n=1 Tax=Thiohalorhabdus denitrificans TaxID=381306 RepID=A0A1G5ALN6_9GAMM|nr:adenosylcobinamide-GDP ribazoletransferase [Thiohalorhabdus denitrificans]SCX78787.1 cobalamin-5'-phosphate synthase [Thiohalorhabdus denitrificans]
MLVPLRLAVQLLTRIPVAVPAETTPRDWGRSVLFYPLVGLAIGVVLLAATAVLGTGHAGMTAVLVVALWLLLTGLLHVDGLADSADAWLGGHGDRDKTLTIMKDPSTGPAGVVVVGVVLVVKVVALTALLESGATLGLLAAPLLARTAAVWLLLTLPYVRAEGLGAGPAEHLSPWPAWGVVAGSLLLGLILTVGMGFAGLVTGAIVLIFLRWLMERRLGGVTGDTIGAAIEVGEAAFLVGMVYALG